MREMRAWGFEGEEGDAARNGTKIGTKKWSRIQLTLKCSATSQDSKAEKRREVEIPPRTRPIMSTQ